MTKKILTAVAVFVLLSIIVIGAVSASPSKQQSETGPLNFLIAVLKDASDKGTLSNSLSVLLSDMLIEYLITPTTGESPAQVRERLTMPYASIPINAPRPPARELGIINIAISDVAPGVGLGSAQVTDAMHYWGVGEVTMKFVDPGVVAPMLAESWELDMDAGLPTGATLTIRDDVIFHGEGLGDRSNNGGSWGPMTAHDIAFTINDGNGAINTASIHWQEVAFATVFGDIPAVAIDDTTLQVTFSKDYVYDPRWSGNLMNDAGSAFSVQSLNRYETVGETEMMDTPFIGTGPLHVVEWIQYYKAILEPVPYDHWNANAQVDRIEFWRVDEQMTRIALMETGEMDAAPIQISNHNFPAYAKGWIQDRGHRTGVARLGGVLWQPVGNSSCSDR